MAPNTIVSCLQQRAASQSDVPVFSFLENKQDSPSVITFSQLDDRARLIASLLCQENATGKNTLLLYPPGLEYIAAFMGCLYAGTVAVPAYPPRFSRSTNRLEAIVKDAQASFALTTKDILTNYERRSVHYPVLNKLRWVATDSLYSYQRSTNWTLPEAEQNQIAFIQYTSGSTGTPKGVILTHENLIQNLAFIQEAFQLEEGSRSVSWLPPYHDMGLIGGILEPIYAGIETTLMAPADFLQRPGRWLEAISQTRAAISGGPDFAYHYCIDNIPLAERELLDLSCWDIAFNGSEPIRLDTLTRFTETFAPHGFRRQAFYPCYGLAEGTLMVTGGERYQEPLVATFDGKLIEKGRVASGNNITLVSSGQSWHQQEVVIVNPYTLQPCQPDEIGEIWVKGPCVAQGYWHQPVETDATFHARIAGRSESFLRTGDLGFVWQNELFVTGRLKDLIIIRGRNLYPQDIEHVVANSHPALQPGSTAAFSIEVDNEEKLIVVQEIKRTSRHNLQTEEINMMVQQAVGQHFEVPVYRLVLAQPLTVPKTSSGKIQRKYCRELWQKGNLQMIAECGWGEEFNSSVKDFTHEDRFPELRHYIASLLQIPQQALDLAKPLTSYGLDSLTAVRLQHYLITHLKIETDLADLLGDTDLLSLLEQSQTDIEIPLVEAPLTLNKSELSQGQRALWFIQQLVPDSPAYNIAVAVRFHSRVNAFTVQEAFHTLLQRHEMLRASLVAQDGVPSLEIRQTTTLSFELVDTYITMAELQDDLVGEAVQPFDLTHDSLLRIRLYQTTKADEQIMLVVVHHSIADLWSMAILVDEFTRLYEAHSHSHPPELPPIETSYTQFVAWQKQLLASAKGQELADYWLKQLRGRLPVLNLPTDFLRPKHPTFAGDAHLLRLDGHMTRNLKRYAQENGVTPYMLLLAVFQVLLYRYTGQEDVLVGTSTSGRSQIAWRQIVGYFANPVVIRSDLRDADRMTFDEFLGQVKQTVLAALAHQDYPFPLLVEQLHSQRDLSRSPLFQIMFVWQQTHLLQGQELAQLFIGEEVDQIDLGSLRLSAVATLPVIAQFDLTVMVAESGQEHLVSFQYNSDLFAHETIVRMATHFQQLVTAILNDSGRPVTHLPLLTTSEMARYVAKDEYLQTGEVPPSTLTQCLVHQLFEQSAQRSPQALALQMGGQEITYRQLHKRANQLAHYLRKNGVGPDVLVGVMMSRSPEMVLSLLAILQAGGAYVPLDPDLPPARLGYILEDTKIQLVLTESQLQDRLPLTAAQLIPVTANLAADESDDSLNIALDGQNLAYVLYTSGSTGTPKGVMVTHQGLSNYLLWSGTEYHWEIGRGTAVHSPITFDLTVTSLWGALTKGHYVQLVPEINSVGALVSVLQEKPDYSIIKLTPTHLKMLRWLLPRDAVAQLQTEFIVGGEALYGEDVAFWLEHAPHSRIVNEYGPTETVVGCCTYRAESATANNVPIGYPIANMEMYVLDSLGQPLPDGLVGELYIGGLGLARAYLNQPGLTAAAFVPHPFSSIPGSRLYRTGDLGRVLPDGSLEFLGRIDQQLKIQGYRLEPGEIEAALCRHNAVQAATIMAVDDASGGKQLVGFVIRNDESLAVSDLITFLKTELPTYMVPARIYFLKHLPVTTNGKIDIQTLQKMATEMAVVPDNIPALPRTPTESILVELWRELLNIEQVGINDNFFELGGHSLLATQFIARIRDLYQLDLPLHTLFETSTVAEVAQTLTHINPQRVEKTSIVLQKLQVMSADEIQQAVREKTGNKR